MGRMSKKIKRRKNLRIDSIQKKVEERQRQIEEMKNTMLVMNAVKMASMLVLRNEGWGSTRLMRFSTKFDEVLADVSAERLSLSDIPKVLTEETGIKIEDITL